MSVCVPLIPVVVCAFEDITAADSADDATLPEMNAPASSTKSGGIKLPVVTVRVQPCSTDTESETSSTTTATRTGGNISSTAGHNNVTTSASLPIVSDAKPKRPHRKLSDGRKRSTSNMLNKSSGTSQTMLSSGSATSNSLNSTGAGSSITASSNSSSSSASSTNSSPSGSTSSATRRSTVHHQLQQHSDDDDYTAARKPDDGHGQSSAAGAAPATIKPSPGGSVRSSSGNTFTPRRFLNPGGHHHSHHGSSLRKQLLTRRSPSPSVVALPAGAAQQLNTSTSLCPGYLQYQMSLLEVPMPRDYGDASSDDLSSEWDSDVPAERQSPKVNHDKHIFYALPISRDFVLR